MPAADVVIEVQDLVVRYPATTAVDGASFRVHPGRVTAVLGPNGAGKTTTIEVCEGLRRPTSGTARVFGADPLHLRADQRARMGVMLQSGGIPSGARAVEFVAHVASLHANPLDAGDLCERLGLDRLGRTSYRRMSGGQKQTLALATAIVGRPELVLLDEPTAGLDPAARHSTWELVSELRDAGVTVVMSTHAMDEAEHLADDVLVIDRGRIVADGTLDELTGGGSNQVVLSTGGGVDHDVMAGALARDLARDLGPGVSVTARGPELVVTGPDDAGLNAAVTRWCTTNDIVITGLRSGRRTLEDVFFDLTGRGLE